MRLEKKFISAEYINRLKSSPFFLVVDYRGMSVGQFNELRKRLAKSGGEMHVVKNTIFRISAKEAGLADLSGVLAGQLAIVTGKKDIAAAAKVLKTYQAEFDKPKLQFGVLGSTKLSAEEVRAIADLPPLAELQGKLLGVLQAPAQKLAALINTPGSQIARVLKAKSEKAEA
ncbi:MAG TPA: 50S ribosomal protein L10 [Candidatus Limnocylindria bacterium]|jgi:large subunit ribosomal protein L10|nr:50S ribosomal protein L10 [Candidatus Limnocylindria bacterium]